MSDAIQTAILAAFSAALERAISQAVATHVQDLQTRLDALADRIDTAGGLADRMAKLETKLTEADLFTQLTSTTAEDARLVDLLDRQGWFWEKLQNRIDSTVEAAMDSHCSDYDHDDYDNHVGDDDKHFDGDIEDAVREALDGQSFTISL